MSIRRKKGILKDKDHRNHTLEQDPLGQDLDLRQVPNLGDPASFLECVLMKETQFMSTANGPLTCTQWTVLLSQIVGEPLPSRVFL